MNTPSFENRVATIIDAVNNASASDASLAIGRTGERGDRLDLLADAIDGLLRRSRENLEALRASQEVMRELQIPGDDAKEDLSQDHLLLMNALKENIPDTIYFKDRQGRFLHLSKAYVKSFNLVRTREVVGMTDFDFFTEEHAQASFEDEQRIIRTGEPVIDKEEKETWSDRPDTWVVTTKMPLRDKQGAIVGTFGISRDITARKRSEEALRKSEERYRMLFNSINDAAFVHGITSDGLPGPITEVNDTTCERMGYTRDELLRMSPLDLESPETAAVAPGMVAQLKAEKHAVWEGVHVSRTGKRIPVEISNHLFDMAGVPTILATVRDITGRKLLEENLEREKALLLTLINNLPDYVSVKDTEGRILITNAANARFMGIASAEDAVGKTDHEFYPASEATRYLEDERAVIQTGTALINKEEESPDREGSKRWTLTTKVPLRNAQGKIMGVVCTGRDITERKQAELALRQEAVRRRILFEEAADGIVVIGQDLRVVEANRSFLTMLGYSLEEILRLHLWDWDVLMPTEERFKAQWPEAPTTRGTIETRHRRKDGTVFDVEISFNPAVVSGESQMYCVCRDITQRKQADERIHDLARFNDESPNPLMRVSLDGSILYANHSSKSLLTSWGEAQGGKVPPEYMPELLQAWTADEKREIEARDGENVIELTIIPVLSRGYINLYGRDVTEEKSLAEKFLQAQKMEAVGRLAGGIAHDFNNLLTVIGGYCELVLEGMPEGSHGRAQINEIAKATKQAANLTGKLLAFSRKQVMMPRVISPNELIRGVENIIARLVGEDIELKTFLLPDAGNIRADPGQIEQVLMNLTVNARDAMPEGGKMTIETSNRILDSDYALEHPNVKAGEYVRIVVSDTGRGMDAEVLSHIFEPFFTTKEQGKGTGLGLSTVYGIVKQSEGHISCYSEIGKGTTFAIYLPRIAEASAPAPASRGEIASVRGSETILLVEDDETVRLMTRTLLENNGYTVIAASGGREALAAIESRRCNVALVVTDVVMPRMSGKELAKRLLLACPKVKVLYVSGYTGETVVHHGMLDPGIDFIQKPFQARELLTKIREILSRHEITLPSHQGAVD